MKKISIFYLYNFSYICHKKNEHPAKPPKREAVPAKPPKREAVPAKPPKREAVPAKTFE
jgi:hypothetical protein